MTGELTIWLYGDPVAVVGRERPWRSPLRAAASAARLDVDVLAYGRPTTARRTTTSGRVGEPVMPV